MRRNSRKTMALGALSALASLMIIPMVNTKTRRRMMRVGRSAYFRASDLFSDIKDMTK